LFCFVLVCVGVVGGGWGGVWVGGGGVGGGGFRYSFCPPFWCLLGSAAQGGGMTYPHPFPLSTSLSRAEIGKVLMRNAF
jgi:hypothetical protein